MAGNFAQVILPLPLYSSFTYAVPEVMKREITIGSRVLVQFGRKKFYTGLVESFSNTPPGNFEIKEIMAVLDESPIIRYPQLNLWEWIAEYYLCSKGDVYKAAVPTGLKPESETWISLNTDYEQPEGIRFTEREALVVQLLDSEKKLKLGDIQDRLKLKNSNALLNRMLDKGIIEISENIVNRYRPKPKPAYACLPTAAIRRASIHFLKL